VTDPAVASARHDWEDGLRRLSPLLSGGGTRLRVVNAVHDELRRRVGSTFRLADLAAAYEQAPAWYLDLASRIAPRDPEVWDPAVTLDGAFALYQRHAVDCRG
jgi:hypothetical protein